ncbi:MAG: caspase family protein [Prevotellaceae bacterium]|nr:caspase family protein [Bacteroidaceae bacterium]MDO4981337.1 caspase family protein [Prevotellaceae bacterium]
MKRKALMIGNSRGLKATPLDMLHFTQFLMSYQGGAWTRDEIEPWMDKDVNELLNDVEKIVKGQNDYVIVYFTGHGGLHGDTIIEVNPKGELIKEDLNELTGKKYQDIAQRLLSQAALAKTRIARKKLADFFKQEKPVLSEIRHNAGAHREHDFMKQMEVLEGVGWSGTIDRLHRFEEVTLELGKTMKPLMEAGLKKIGEAFGK